jgi:predicted amidohydrolase YtcJ
MSHVPALLVATLLVALCAGREEVDLVLTGGKVAIVDEAFGIHETIVIDDARVLAVGDAGLADRYDAARRVELDGRLIVPGFNDTHTHINGRPRRHIDLAGTESIAEIQARWARASGSPDTGGARTSWSRSQDRSRSARPRAVRAGTIIVSAYELDGRRWYPGCMDAVVGVCLDDAQARESVAVDRREGRAVLRASPYPRPIPGVPKERNLNGISFAVANAAGCLAAALAAHPHVRTADGAIELL